MTAPRRKDGRPRPTDGRGLLDGGSSNRCVCFERLTAQLAFCEAGRFLHDALWKRRSERRPLPFARRIERAQLAAPADDPHFLCTAFEKSPRFASISASAFESERTSMQISGTTGLASASDGICRARSVEIQITSGTFTPSAV